MPMCDMLLGHYRKMLLYVQADTWLHALISTLDYTQCSTHYTGNWKYLTIYVTFRAFLV